jgi:predicted transglutaminase-like cysteine proteinase
VYSFKHVITLALLLGLAVFLGLWLARPAVPMVAGPPPVVHIPSGTPAGPPPGFVTYCMHNSGACVIDSDMNSAPLALDAVRRKVIESVNLEINRLMPYRSDREHYGITTVWSVDNLSEGGECHDYALAKQQALLGAGLPRSVLRLAVVRTAEGELHAVLTVITTQGDLVLDNRTGAILPWNRTGYTWLLHQSANNPLAWTLVDPL